MRHTILGLAFALASVMPALHASAQPATGPSGHWEGAIETPKGKLEIAIDLAPRGDEWNGTITIPSQSLKGYPLTSVTVKGNAVTFSMSAPGDPLFTGKLDSDGRVLAGDLSQGGAAMPFSLARTGDAKFEAVVPSTAIGKELEGNWDGTLSVSGQTLRLVLKLTIGADGRAKGTLVSIDQGGVEIPIQTITQTAAHVTLLIPSISGSYEADVKDGQLSGTWTQGPAKEPLVFKRAVK